MFTRNGENIPTLTQEELKAELSYDPVIGFFTRLYGRNAGKQITGGLNTDKHRQIRVGGKLYYAAQLAFLYQTGHFAKPQVDHINAIPYDDRWENLREATGTQNCWNRHPRGNKYGFKGVSFNNGRYHASIVVREDGKKRRKHLGCFKTPDEAGAAYVKAATELHQDFIRWE